MGDHQPVVQLPEVAPARLAAAVHAVLTGDAARGAALPSADHLRAGAAATTGDAGGPAARRFQALLELGYLAASADGLDAGEREALARLLEQVTGAAVDRDTLELHFRDLDEAVAMLGRRERLARVAAELDDGDEPSEALGFAALVAMADGRLGAAELDVLVELGASLALGAGEVRAVVDQVAASLEMAVRS
jgi:tellurite resistance protein